MSFLKFTGVSSKEKEHCYLFEMEGQKSQNYIDDYINVPSPIIDNILSKFLAIIQTLQEVF